MFINSQTDIKKERLLNIFNQLEGSLRDCIIEQSEILLKLQKQNNITRKEED